MAEPTRRALLAGLLGGWGTAAAVARAAPAVAPGDAVALRGDAAAADDEAYWRAVDRDHYDAARPAIALENGNFGMMPRRVAQAHAAFVQRVNAEGAWYARRAAGADLLRVRSKVASALGVDSREIVLTRGATESLLALVQSYPRLRPGHTLLYADHDYDSIQAAMRWLARRDGVRAVQLALPEPATYQGLIDAYAQALESNPSTRLMLLTHVGHRSGLVLPVAEIIAMARQRGVDVIVDAAHAWGQVPLDLRGMGIDFAGLTCHKWIGAPLGVGLIYVRRDRLPDLAPCAGSEEAAERAVDNLVHTGTRDLAAVLALEPALDFVEALGPQARLRRLQALRDHWVEPLRGLSGIELLTPADPRLHGGMTSFRLAGRTTAAENSQLARQLLEEHRIFTVHRTGLARGACVRVTPAVFTQREEVELLRRVLAGWAA
ncbi:MAG: hypothetical protein RL026_140 [Pseudomonadota bacterium]|jgi:selenocysteine lyase/cysteine desulfurase